MAGLWNVLVSMGIAVGVACSQVHDMDIVCLVGNLASMVAQSFSFGQSPLMTQPTWHRPAAARCVYSDASDTG